MTIFCITQARMGSSRLPGKAMMEIQGKPLIQYHIERVGLARTIDKHIIATSDNPGDHALAEFCDKQGTCYFRGSEQDVLQRFFDAASDAGARPNDVVVRLTGDCPLIAPELIDKTIESHQAAVNVDYSHISLDYYPRGFDTEVFTMQTLTEACLEATSAAEREHVTPFIYRRPHRYQLNPVIDSATSASQLRLCVDEPQDFELISQIIDRFGHDIIPTTGENIIDFTLNNPELMAINKNVAQIDLHSKPGTHQAALVPQTPNGR